MARESNLMVGETFHVGRGEAGLGAVKGSPVRGRGPGSHVWRRGSGCSGRFCRAFARLSLVVAVVAEVLWISFVKERNMRAAILTAQGQGALYALEGGIRSWRRVNPVPRERGRPCFGTWRAPPSRSSGSPCSTQGGSLLQWADGFRAGQRRHGPSPARPRGLKQA